VVEVSQCDQRNGFVTKEQVVVGLRIDGDDIGVERCSTDLKGRFFKPDHLFGRSNLGLGCIGGTSVGSCLLLFRLFGFSSWGFSSWGSIFSGGRFGLGSLLLSGFLGSGLFFGCLRGFLLFLLDSFLFLLVLLFLFLALLLFLLL